jgi:hypothetical protein
MDREAFICAGELGMISHEVRIGAAREWESGGEQWLR